MPGFVGQNEWRHRLADLRCRVACPILTKPRYEPIHCSSKFRSVSPYRLSKSVKLLAQRYIQIAHASESVVQALSLDIRIHGKVSPQALAVPNLEPSGMILQKSDTLWTPLSIDIVVPLSLRDVVRARASTPTLDRRKSTESCSNNHDPRRRGLLGSHFKLTSLAISIWGSEQRPARLRKYRLAIELIAAHVCISGRTPHAL